MIHKRITNPTHESSVPRAFGAPRERPKSVILAIFRSGVVAVAGIVCRRTFSNFKSLVKRNGIVEEGKKKGETDGKSLRHEPLQDLQLERNEKTFVRIGKTNEFDENRVLPQLQ